MPGPVLHAGATGSCTHGGTMSVISQNRVLVNGTPAATVADTYPVAACPFNVNGSPMPCVLVRWVPSSRVLVDGKPAILATDSGMALNAAQAPQGTAVVTSVQARVMA